LVYSGWQFVAESVADLGSWRRVGKTLLNHVVFQWMAELGCWQWVTLLTNG